VIKYLGSKRLLAGRIVAAVRACAPPPGEGGPTVLDLFSGTARIGHALKAAGFRVVANDHNAYALALARCYVQADREDVIADAERLVEEFNRLPGRPGYFTETYCLRSRFFRPRNGERVDAIRDAIARKGLDEELEAVMLVSLMEAADRVDSTTGVQMAYLKEWAPRAANDLRLRVPDVLPRPAAGKCRALSMEAAEAARAVEADVAYLDPPYNQHSYLRNYHIWETLVRWDRPAVYGVACKRTDCRERRSPFNSRRAFERAFAEVVGAVRAPAMVVSFNDEGYLSPERARRILRSRGRVRAIGVDYPRYVGARIGIYNPHGEKVGRVSHLRNTEYLFTVTPRRAGGDGPGRVRRRRRPVAAAVAAPAMDR
jgi:adenine-specific DNA-methyltransferase